MSSYQLATNWDEEWYQFVAVWIRHDYQRYQLTTNWDQWYQFMSIWIRQSFVRGWCAVVPMSSYQYELGSMVHLALFVVCVLSNVIIPTCYELETKVPTCYELGSTVDGMNLCQFGSMVPICVNSDWTSLFVVGVLPRGA